MSKSQGKWAKALTTITNTVFGESEQIYKNLLSLIKKYKQTGQQMVSKLSFALIFW
jgi:hypothetical protein